MVRWRKGNLVNPPKRETDNGLRGELHDYNGQRMHREGQKTKHSDNSVTDWGVKRSFGTFMLSG